MLSCRRRILPVLSIQNKDLRDFPEAGNRETGGTEQRIAAAELGSFATEPGIKAAHSRVSLSADSGAICHAIMAIFAAFTAMASTVMTGPGKGGNASQPDETIARRSWTSIADAAADHQPGGLQRGNYCLYYGVVPTIRRFASCKIAIYADDHMPPHFHIKGRGFRAIVEIDTMNLWAGDVRRAEEALI